MSTKTIGRNGSAARAVVDGIAGATGKLNGFDKVQESLGQEGKIEQGYKVIGFLAAILGLTLTGLNAFENASGWFATIMLSMGFLILEAGLLYSKYILSHALCTDKQRPYFTAMVFSAAGFIFLDAFVYLATRDSGGAGWMTYLVGAEAGVILILYTLAILADDRRQATMYALGVQARATMEQKRDAYSQLMEVIKYNTAVRIAHEKARHKAVKALKSKLRGYRAWQIRRGSARVRANEMIAESMNLVSRPLAHLPVDLRNQAKALNIGEAKKPTTVGVNGKINGAKKPVG